MTSQPTGPEGQEPRDGRGGDAVPGSAFRPAREEPSPEARSSSSRRRRSPVRNLIEWLLVLGGALVVALLIKTFLFQAFYIPSESMEPTLTRGDRVLVNKLDDGIDDISRGDIIVFGRPPNEPPSEIDDLIKRVVGLPGETVEGRGGQVWVDGEPLDETYLSDGIITDPFPPVEIPDGFVFVMGDNRGNSRDSRVFGPIDGELIVGRAFVTVWPLGRVGGL